MQPDGYWAVSALLAVVGVWLSGRRLRQLRQQRRDDPDGGGRRELLAGHCERERYRLAKQALLGLIPWLLLLGTWVPLALPPWLRLALFWGPFLSVQGLFIWTSVREDRAKARVEAAIRQAQPPDWTGEERRYRQAGPP